MLTPASAMLSPWLVIPLAGLTLLIIAWHVVGLNSALDMPPRRRRIRTANGLLMMLLAALLAYGLAVEPAAPTGAGAERGQRFVLLWLLIIGLLGIVVLLAVLDAAHTLALAAMEREALRRELRRRPPRAAIAPGAQPSKDGAERAGV